LINSNICISTYLTKLHPGVCWYSNIHSNSWWGKWAGKTWKYPRNPLRLRYPPIRIPPLGREIKSFIYVAILFVVTHAWLNVTVYSGFWILKLENSTCCS